jgi:hypothetical protein
MLSERAKWEKEMGSAIARLKAEMGESIRGHGAAQVGSAAATAYCCPTDLHCPWSAAAIIKTPIGLRRSIGWPPSICNALRRRMFRACSHRVCCVRACYRNGWLNSRWSYSGESRQARIIAVACMRDL